MTELLPVQASSGAQIIVGEVAPARSRTEEHLPQLDGLRCLAVLLVIWEHVGWEGPHYFGTDGVRLFFVLSAFLITGILLRVRDQHAPLGRALRAFYARRLLRLLPAYYVLLALTALLHFPNATRDLVPNLLYLSNWRYIQLDWPAPLGHLWTLAIEEQFYLIWPFLILLVPRRRLPVVAVAAVVISVVTRTVLFASGHRIASHIATISNFDALGMGALLAWHYHVHLDRGAARRRWLRAGLVAGMLLLACSIWIGLREGRSGLQMATEAWGAAVVAVWLIDRAALGITGPIGALLHAAPVRYVGRVSYCIYLVQSPLGWAIALFIGGHAPWGRGFPMFFLISALSVAYASVSWRYIEAPVNAFKRRFPYPAYA